MIDELLLLLSVRVCSRYVSYRSCILFSPSANCWKSSVPARVAGGSLLLELVHGCGCNHCLCCYLDQKGLEMVTLYEDVLHPPRTWPIQRARTCQKRVATAHAGHPSDILIVHSFWHQNASADWTKEIFAF